ncbi:MAG: hypothetical protein GKR90_05535 [Pseudomonadales bacterium]|nr:hypothetical protein [Pseudomonadales bacterium]
MIAAAMATRNPRKYKELAKAEASVNRTVPPSDLMRLAQEAIAVGETHASYLFSFTGDGCPKVDTRVESEVTMACQWCLEPKAIKLCSSYEALLAQDEKEAMGWLERITEVDEPQEVMVVGRDFDAVRLIEDELLLSLPHQICEDTKCPQRPARVYKDVGDEEKTIESPFASLAMLKDGLTDS